MVSVSVHSALPCAFSSVTVCRSSHSAHRGWFRREDMDPAVLIFLLYVLIAHELFCGVREYWRQANKPRKRPPGPMLYSSIQVQGAWSVSSQPTRTERWRESPRKGSPRKGCRIVRKA